MSVAGEINQHRGRAYMLAFVGCLEASISGFQRSFLVTDNPSKVTFKPFADNSFSFDAVGQYNTASSSNEVFLECKGYSDGGNLFDEYKRFVARAYLTSAMFARHSNDHFWFVCNVPFACSQGRRLTTYNSTLDILTNSDRDNRIIPNDIIIDDDRVRLLSSKISVFILTDEYMKAMGIRYIVKQDDVFEHIVYDLHGGPMDYSRLNAYYSEFRQTNRSIQDPNLIYPGQVLKLPWFGFPQ